MIIRSLWSWHCTRRMAIFSWYWKTFRVFSAGFFRDERVAPVAREERIWFLILGKSRSLNPCFFSWLGAGVYVAQVSFLVRWYWERFWAAIGAPMIEMFTETNASILPNWGYPVVLQADMPLGLA